MAASSIVDQLETLLREHPGASIVVFVPRSQLAHALETALARRRGSWEGLRFVLPRSYARTIARVDLIQSGRMEAGVEGHLFRTARILQSHAETSSVEGLPGWHLLAGTVAEALDSLRRNDVDVAAVHERAETSASSETLSVISDCYHAYVGELDQERLYDDAHVFEWATARVENEAAPDVPETVYAAVRSSDLSEHAAQFLNALQVGGRDFFLLGPSISLDPPPTTAAARFPHARAVPESSGDAIDGTGARETFIRAVGARTEVKSVFRDIMSTGVSFDDVTVAYTTSRPYASLLADEAERIEIPMTMGTGLPADHTRTGRALRGLFEWVLDDFDPEVLIRLLRSGLLRTDRWLRRRAEDETLDSTEEAERVLRPHEAATLLAERSYESGREGLLRGLQSAVEAADDRAGSGRTPTPREERRRRRLSVLRAYVRDLAKLVPESTDLTSIAERACTFLKVFGPTDRPSTPEAERSPDEAARLLLYDRLETLGTMEMDWTASAHRGAALFGRWLDGQYVQAEKPRPGHVHVLPLESAGYSDRSDLYIVGLDSTTFSAPGVETGMLQEADRRALVASFDQIDAGSSERSSPADEALWQAEGALRRHRGRTVFCTRIFDVEAGEERDPSSLFLQRERDADGNATEGGSTSGVGANRVERRFAGLTVGEDSSFLSDGECWLSAYRRAGASVASGASTGSSGADASARARLRAENPWILEGEEARAARQSDAYTMYDGLLPLDAYPDLRLVDNRASPVSASRLELLAKAPYLYFLKYILDVEPLEEPALDDEPWFNHRRKGSLLHEIYERFVRGIAEGRHDADDGARMSEVVRTVLQEEVEQFAPPSPVVEASARRVLEENALLFVRSESERASAYAPTHLEWAFGEGSVARPAQISIGDAVMHLRGRVDRVDRHRGTGTLSAWDYKTGGSSNYDESDPVQDGKTLQWALYAYAVEDLLGETVETSGYFFANVKEMGRRISASPRRHRDEVEAVLEQLGAIAESGSFPMTPDLHDVDEWTWGGYDWIVDDLGERRDQLKAKSYPDDRPQPPSF